MFVRRAISRINQAAFMETTSEVERPFEYLSDVGYGEKRLPTFFFDAEFS